MRSAAFCLIVLLGGCIRCYTHGLPDGDGSADAAPAATSRERSPDVLAVLRGAFGDLYGTEYENQRALQEPASFWSRHRLYRVVNYTWPHCPGCKAALSEAGEVVLLSGMADGLRSQDPVGAFNRIARAEGRAVARDEAGAYARFFMRCYVGAYEDARLQGTRAAAESRELPAAPLTVEALADAFVVRGWYAGYRSSVGLRIRIRSSDGTVELSTF